MLYTEKKRKNGEKMNTFITQIIQQKTGNIVTSIQPVGKGASGSVYQVCCNGTPKKIALKISYFTDLLQDEYNMLCFLKEQTNGKFPTPYFFWNNHTTAILAMEFIEGISGKDITFTSEEEKEHLAHSIVDNLIQIQKTHHDKFGPYQNATYETWNAYYKEFADNIYQFCIEQFEQQKLDKEVMDTVTISYKKFDEIFCETITTPTLIHGDYWMPNFIIDSNTMELKSVVDPFNIMWADPEYELFAMTVGIGAELHLYEIYKSKLPTSKFCDVKLEVYALYSELLWYKRLGEISHEYLRYRSNSLMKAMKQYGFI